MADLHLPQLKELDVSNNCLQSVDSVVLLNTATPHLCKLNMANNIISDLNGLKDVKLSSLAHVNLSANKLELIEDKSLMKLIHISENLLTLELRGNPAPDSYEEAS